MPCTKLRMETFFQSTLQAYHPLWIQQLCSEHINSQHKKKLKNILNWKQQRHKNASTEFTRMENTNKASIHGNKECTRAESTKPNPPTHDGVIDRWSGTTSWMCFTMFILCCALNNFIFNTLVNSSAKSTKRNNYSEQWLRILMERA